MRLAQKNNFYSEGLESKDALKKLKKHGYNVIQTGKKRSVLSMFFSQFNDLMVIILMCSTLISAVLGELVEAATILAIIVVNSFFGLIQEYKTEKTLDALKKLTAPVCKVVRGGVMCSIPAIQLVPDDVILLSEGDRIPADAVVVESFNISVDESLLTGESLSVEKESTQIYLSPNSNNKIYMGTVIVRGHGTAIATKTGMKTEMGKIASMIKDTVQNDTPLQKKLEQLGKYIAIGCLTVCALVCTAGIIRGEDIYVMMLAGISLAVAAVPEGLPAVVTVSLAIGVQRMLKRNALVRRLPAVETLGCADVICSDKTGTLTENKMQVKKLYIPSRYITVTDDFEMKTVYTDDKGIVCDALKSSVLLTNLKIFALCNNSIVQWNNTDVSKADRSKRKMPLKHEIIGDPTENALMEVAINSGLADTLLDDYRKIDEIPFDSDRRLMSVICIDKKGDKYVFTKGAPDEVLKRCNKGYQLSQIVQIDDKIKSQIKYANNKLASDALRVLAVAFKKLPKDADTVKLDIESDLVFGGLVGMMDPPRKEAFDAVAKCKLAGIKPVMITGDHKLTACAVATELGILNNDDIVVSGAEIDVLDDEKLLKTAEKCSVYARVTPGHKLRIVKILKRLGHIVAMTGDGVNDAPAVKESDIGIAMGITGTDVTREAASMILSDDNFATIVKAVEEGRIIFTNIRKFIRYLLSCNIGEVLTMFVGMLIGLPLPLLPIQILWVNLVTDGLPAIALGMEPGDDDVMIRPPRQKNAGVFSGGLGILIISRGILIGLSTLLVFSSIYYLTNDVTLARTSGFVTLVLTQLIHVFECKSEKKTLFEISFFNNMYLIIATGCSLAMILLAVYAPFLQAVFKTVPLSINEWLLIIGFSMIGPIIFSIFRIKAFKKTMKR